MTKDNITNPLVAIARRTTIITHDIDKSLHFYRDTLGMQIWFDEIIDQQQQCEAYDLPEGSTLRVCIVAGSANSKDNSNALISGMVGLMEFLDIEEEPAEPPTLRPKPGQTMIVLDTEHMREIEKRLILGGYKLPTPPARLNVPGRDVVYELLTYDPNGIRINFAQYSEID